LTSTVTLLLPPVRSTVTSQMVSVGVFCDTLSVIVPPVTSTFPAVPISTGRIARSLSPKSIVMTNVA
jgi:hypothetical protein